jgi:hypothetical protein
MWRLEKRYYQGEVIMANQGWWEQVFYNDYPETKTDYGQFQFQNVLLSLKLTTDLNVFS